ncbi:MAG: hypothetical protein OEM85_05690 [Gammaproteobacteria bacterium]|nr:hypothetical protein [Gammaproteobacteria bacterium]MDH3372852.1 hypothetical protein [Gammaproteobacteria bacterium]
MRRIRAQVAELVRVAIISAALSVAGCSALAPVPDTGGAEIVIEPPPEVVEIKPPVEPAKPPPLPPQLPAVAIVLTSNQPAYADVAQELARHFEDYAVYDLNDDGRPPVSILRQINDSDSAAVVAIGLRAARSAVAMAGVPVIFSQVFNHQDHDLLHDNSRGIAALPPLDAQIVAWKKIDPTVARIGIIVGQGHSDLVAEAELAAERHSVELRVQFSHSDQETLYLFKRMIRDIDGYWMFPDNRILSARILQEMLDEANRHRVAVVVPNEALLQMGAAISISTVASDIAETIVKVIRQIQDGELDRVPPVTALSQIRVATNDELLKQPAVARTTSADSAQDVER